MATELSAPMFVVLGLFAAPGALLAQDSGFHGGASHAGHYESRDGEFGGVRWRYQTGAPVRSSPLLVEGVVYVGSSDGFVYALDAASGALRWRAGAGAPVTSSPAVAGGVVVVGGRDGRFTAMATASGQALWTVEGAPDAPLPWGYESGDSWTSSPTISGSRVFLGGGEGTLRAVDLTTGREIWRAKAGGRLRSSPAVDSELVVVGSTDGHVYGFAAADGARRWRFATEGVALESGKFGFDRRTVQSSPALDAATVYVGARDGFIYAIDRVTGRERWRFDHQVSWVNTTPALADGIVYAGSSDGLFVQALDATSGRELWRRKTKGIVWGSPAVTGGAVYVPDGAGWLYSMDRKSGSIRWEWNAGARIFSSPALAGGGLYVGSDDGAIYALDVGAARAFRRAVFWDSALIRAASVGPHVALRTYLADRGFKVLDAAALDRWLEGQTGPDTPSAVVFAVDHISVRSTAMLRRYLERGGVVVWPGSAPLLWPRDPATGAVQLQSIDRAAATRLLGVGFERGNFDPIGISRLEPSGRALGMRQGALVRWGADAETVTRVLAYDELGQAAAWAKQIGAGWLVRIPVFDAGDGGAGHAGAVKAAAELQWR